MAIEQAWVEALKHYEGVQVEQARVEAPESYEIVQAARAFSHLAVSMRKVYCPDEEAAAEVCFLHYSFALVPKMY